MATKTCGECRYFVPDTNHLNVGYCKQYFTAYNSINKNEIKVTCHYFVEKVSAHSERI